MFLIEPQEVGRKNSTGKLLREIKAVNKMISRGIAARFIFFVAALFRGDRGRLKHARRVVRYKQ